MRFRDELKRLALHSGFSTYFILQYEKGSFRGNRDGRDIIAQHDSWKVSYNTTPQYAEPNLRAARDIKKVQYTGRTWCVTLPPDFVIVRRAKYSNDKGYITLASRPIIAKNCHAGINRSASLIAAHLMSDRGLSFAQAENLLQKANTKRKIPVLTNKHFVHAMKNYRTGSK